MVAVFVQGRGDQNPLYLRAATNALASVADVITGTVLRVRRWRRLCVTAK